MNDEVHRARAYKLQAEICRIMANEKRLEIFDLLTAGEKSVDELTQAMGISKANVSQHLAVMRQKRMVETRREGHAVYYRIANEKVIEACHLMKEVTRALLADSQALASALGQ